MADCGCGANYMQGGRKGKSLSTEKKTELYEKAKKYQIKGRSTMNKEQLVEAIRKHQKEVGKKISNRRH